GQRFRLRRDPTTWVHDATGERGVRSTLEVFVNDERWTRVESLAESGPDDRHYAVEADEEGVTAVVFGDGRFGARLPTGRNNVRARYRVGIGAQGNVGAGAIRSAVQPLEFVESTRNPVPAAGGADAETTEEVRRMAPLAVRTLDRAVSLADFAELALAYAGIAKARADGGWEGRRRRVVVTVASTGGQPLTPGLRDGVKAFLASRAAPGERFSVRDFRPWPVRLALEVRVLPAFLRLETMVRVQEALGSALTAAGGRGFFHFDRLGLGQDLYLSDVYALVEGVSGVDYVVARAFHAEGDPAPGAVRDRIRVPADAIATGGDPADPAIGVLTLDVSGGVA
ncbi:MAG TPA: putative baseplate assembly protein, partial [Longimicrobiaceae bacterium]|nr:putative baseplate assembly protein [Longimicrobiaceae bacterium]